MNGQTTKITIEVNPATLYELMFALGTHINSLNGLIQETPNEDRKQLLTEIRDNVAAVRQQLEDARKLMERKA
ncbi:MAG TPA: hypothetical protein O0X39_01175 [Methanocorpusculum sp.]|nr:hypothetical protein [Methanocorpusculum sp.]